MIPKMRIKEVRLSKKLTQKKLSKLIPISQSYLSELENNKKNPSVQLLCKIADALEVSPEQLIYYV